MNQNSIRSGIDINEKHISNSSNSFSPIAGHAHSLRQKTQHMQQLGMTVEQIDNKLELDQEMMAADANADASIFIDSTDNQNSCAQDPHIASNTSSTMSNTLPSNLKNSDLKLRSNTTPSTDSKSEMKSLAGELNYSCGGKDYDQPILNHTPSKLKEFNQNEQEELKQEIGQLNQGENDLKVLCLQNTKKDYSFDQINQYSASSTIIEQANNDRIRRSCRDKTTKYSLTHKGAYINLTKHQEDEIGKSRNSVQSKRQSQDQAYAQDSNQANIHSQNGEDPQHQQHIQKRSVPRTAEECAQTIKNMFAFDWDLKEIQNLRHSPQQELTHSVFWFYVNSLYFPFRSLQISQSPFDEFASPILQNLIPNLNNEEIKQSDDNINNDELSQSGLKLIQPLFNEKHMKKFRKLFRDLQERALQESFKLQEPIVEVNEENTSHQEQINNELYDDQQLQKFKTIISVLKTEVKTMSETNKQILKEQFQSFQDTYSKAIRDESQQDQMVYKQDDMLTYDQSFLSQIDPFYIKDIQENFDWYIESYNEILLNVGYPSKQEKEFLKHIEYVQQKKNDMKYKRILKQIEQGKRGNAIIRDEQLESMSMHKRALVTQEDAQCAICNNGDYEDEDLIVFCGNCNVPVHQSCYGIDQLPEGDWVCYSCDIFGFKRGLMTQCLLCPKKGGAMKPTNIFTSVHNYRKFNSGNNHQKKSSKRQNVNQQETGKLQFVDREDKSLSIAVILKRELDYQQELRVNNDELEQQINELELHFDKTEKETQTPEDYNFFLQRNEQRLESEYSPQTPTLYHWVHLSCCSWIPGLMVTPKTPVRLNKLDDKRFSLQCIICLKKDGASMQCQASRCTIAFHVECARRANYCMEIERHERDKSYRMFCEKHRPLKIVKEMEEKDKQTIEEIQRFCKIIDKCIEIDQKARLKQKFEKENQGVTKSANNQKTQQADRSKKWREKEKKTLFERVKEKYLMYRKLRVNIIRVDPQKRIKKSSQRKRSAKRQKKLSHIGGCREGLRSKQPSMNIDMSEDVFIQEEVEMSAIIEDEKLIEQTIEPQVDDTIDQLLHYKLNTPMYQQEVDWTITLSRNDFPWHEIQFNNFSAKECFEKYSSIVRDSQTFLKKILGLKEKYKKLIQSQLLIGASLLQIIVPLVGGGTYDSAQYCKCLGQIQNDFFVKCDGDDECPNGGWLHPQCTNDLKDKIKEELDAIQEWYCEDCVNRIQKEENEDQGLQEEIFDVVMEEQNVVIEKIEQKEEDQEKKQDYGFISQESSSIRIELL